MVSYSVKLFFNKYGMAGEYRVPLGWTRWQIIKKVRLKMNLELVRLPLLMLNWPGPGYPTREKTPLRGHNLPYYHFKDKIVY